MKGACVGADAVAGGVDDVGAWDGVEDGVFRVGVGVVGCWEGCFVGFVS